MVTFALSTLAVRPLSPPPEVKGKEIIISNRDTGVGI
jgi:hypothetical protein